MSEDIKEKMTIGKAKKILRGFLAKDCYIDTPLYYAIPYILDYIINLQEENERLNNIIDKAIEYINEQLSQGGERELRDLVDGYELLEILDKEGNG